MSVSSAPNLLPHHGEVRLFSGFFSRPESDVFLDCFLKKISWAHQPVKMFGKQILQPRLTASFADEGVSYGYTGLKLNSYPWTSELSEIKKRVELQSGATFNSALLNLYRHGNDYMGWHRDNEKHLGKNPPVVSVSFGASRKFQLRTHQEKSGLISVELGHGDLLVMLGEVQQHWEHRLPKSPSVSAPRVNITFRKIFPER